MKTRVEEGKNEGSEEMEEMGGIWVANFLGRKEESTRFDDTGINEAAKATHHLDLLLLLRRLNYYSMGIGRPAGSLREGRAQSPGQAPQDEKGKAPSMTPLYHETGSFWGTTVNNNGRWPTYAETFHELQPLPIRRYLLLSAWEGKVIPHARSSRAATLPGVDGYS